MKPIKIKSKIPLSGILSISKKYPDGTEEKVFHEENLIVLTARQLVLSWLYTFPALTADPIRYLKIGTGGTIDPGGLFPKQEDQSWTELNTPLTSIGTGGLVATTFVTDLTVPSVSFLVDIDQSTANGLMITEAGLFRNSTAMFNIKCFPGIPKTSEFTLHFSWTLKIA
jgi:hypothetical protein